MPDGQRQSSTGWTVDTLHEHIDRILNDLRLHVDEKFSDQAKSVDIALKVIMRTAEKSELQDDKWRENANEWRAAMDDRERNFMPRAMGYLLALVTLIVAIVAVVVNFLPRSRP